MARLLHTTPHILKNLSINAEEALKHGLISEIVKEDKLESRVDEIAELINLNSKAVIALGIT